MSDEYGFKLSKEFMRRASPLFSETVRMDTPTMAIRRPPMPERQRSDYKPTHMADYLDGLERRMIRHLERHAPAWHKKEMARLITKWNSAALNHPAPHGAAPRNRLRDASDYAARKVEQRIAKRFDKIEAVKMRFGLFDDSIRGVMDRAQRRANISDKMRIS